MRASLSKSEQLQGLLFIAPSLLLIIVLVAFPIAFSFYSSFHNVSLWRGEWRLTFVGLGNYQKLFASDAFWHSALRTVIYTFLRVGGAVVLGFATALLMNRAGKVGQLFKNIFILPWAISYVVNAIMWGWIYHGTYGVLNDILLRTGLIETSISWLSNPKTALYAIVVVDIWKNIPFSALILYAGLRTIPLEYYDAAKVDGASAFQCFWHVIIPIMSPIIVTVILIQFIWAMKAFDTIWTLTQGGFDTTILNVFAFKHTFTYLKFGYGAAASYVLALAILLGILLFARFKRELE